jgi:hypothetical protein
VEGSVEHRYIDAIGRGVLPLMNDLWRSSLVTAMQLSAAPQIVKVERGMALRRSPNFN